MNTTLYEDEMQILRWSDSSARGATVTFALPDRDKLAAFLGKDGKRVACVLVEIGDDEKPVKQPLGPLCLSLVKWCDLPHFREFLVQEFPICKGEFDECLTARASAKHAGVVVKAILGIDSRKTIDTDLQAKKRFLRDIQGPWQKWCLARGIIE